MPDIENIQEESREDRKPESPEDVNNNILQKETIEQTETVHQRFDISTSEIKNMEVHHHPKVEKKNFKEYLLEGLMIFLAVFMGFLAENLREYQTDKERAKQYIESFYEDLKTDTARMTSYTDFDDEKLTALGNLNNCFDTVSKNMKATSCLLEMIKISALNRPFKMTERTLNQLTNAGGFRLLQSEDADSIIAYQNAFENFQDFQVTVFQQAQDNIRTTFDLLVNFKANVQMFKPQGRRININFSSKEVTNPVLLSDDAVLLNKYFNELLLYYRVTYNHKERLLELKNSQISLINYFKHKYHFE